jgi:hypothetical protein
MTADDDVLPTALAARRTWQFDWVLPLFVRPRATLDRVASATHAVWQTPIALLVLAAVGRALLAGRIESAAAAAGEIALPPGFEFYTPEQMAQFQQAATATSTPMFTYVLPSLGGVLGVLMMWLVISWLLHLVLTLLGGRGTSQATVNIVAWASLPLLLRSLVQIVAMLVTDRVIGSPGLAGFAPGGEGFLAAWLGALLSQIDIYLIWQIVLLIIGAKLLSQLSTAKSVVAVLLVMALVMGLRGLPAAVLAQFGDLTVIQPFF